MQMSKEAIGQSGVLFIKSHLSCLVRQANLAGVSLSGCHYVFYVVLGISLSLHDTLFTN
jgi:hypothetical protein